MIHVEEDLYSPKITQGESPSVEVKLRVFADPGQRVSALEARVYAMEWLAKNPAPVVTGFQRLTSVQIDPISGSDGNSFEVTLSFTKWKTKRTIFSMDTGGETAKRYYGQTTAAAGRLETDTPPNFYGGINFQNGEFQGMDIPVPGAKFSISTAYPFDFLTDEYAHILTLYRGCVNDEHFIFWDRGEVLFLGASIQMEEETTAKGQARFFWRVTFNFQASPNVTGLTNNGTLQPISKKGWEAYWVYSAAKPDPAAQRIVQYPVAHYAVQVATPVSFAALSIPDFRLQIQG
ncbi:MAG: hypothetical protein Q4D17_00055 [Planctomycetia bacterium]|nr:hypothetical protein [Planctomycetia bacterium]